MLLIRKRLIRERKLEIRKETEIKQLNFEDKLEGQLATVVKRVETTTGESIVAKGNLLEAETRSLHAVRKAKIG